jgi:hypothetical protein
MPRLEKTTSNARIHGSGDPEKLNKRFQIPSKKNGERLALPTLATRAPSSRTRKSVSYAEKTLKEIDEEDIGAFPSQIDLTEDWPHGTQKKGKGKGKGKPKVKGRASEDEIETSEDDEDTMLELPIRKVDLTVK